MLCKFRGGDESEQAGKGERVRQEKGRERMDRGFVGADRAMHATAG